MFIKLFTQILDSSIADNRPLRHFFTDLLLCANGDGNVVMTDAAIARRIGATVAEVQEGLAELQKPDPFSKTPDFEGRRIIPLDGTGYGWHIINFETYRAMRDADQLRAVTRARVQKHRELKRRNAHVTPGNACNPKEKERKSTDGEGEKESKELFPVPAKPAREVSGNSSVHAQITGRIGSVFKETTGEEFAFNIRFARRLKSFLMGWSGTADEWLEFYREVLVFSQEPFAPICRQCSDPVALCDKWLSAKSEIAKLKADEGRGQKQQPTFKY